MAHLIDKDKAIAEIKNLSAYLDTLHEQRIIEKILSIMDTLEVKGVDLEDEVDKDDYRKQFQDGTKLNIDSTTEINFDESTKFNLYDYIKMKEEEKTNSSKFYKKMFKNIPTVSMKIFSWWNRNKRKENKLWRQRH